MPIKLNGTTFNNGGTAKYNTTNLKEIKYGSTTVWKAEKTFSGSSQAWNNTSASQNKTFVSGMDLRGFSQIKFTVNFGAKGWAGGNAYGVRHAIGSGDTATTYLRVVFNGSGYNTVISASGNGQGTGIGVPVLPKEFTVDISSRSESQLSSVSIKAYGTFTYSDPTNKFVIMDWTVGTVTAS